MPSIRGMSIFQRSWYWGGRWVTSFPPEYIYELVKRWDCLLCVTCRMSTVNLSSEEIAKEVIKAEEEKMLVRIELDADDDGTDYNKFESEHYPHGFHVYKCEWKFPPDIPSQYPL